MRLSLLLSSLIVLAELTAAEPPPYRAAASVHLSYPAPACEWFYNEVVVEQTVNGSYFMACGWNTGYFGIQQLDRPDDKVVIFSVWDPTAGDDPKAVKGEDRVEVLATGEGVRIRRFGGEGTGGQCMAPFVWKTAETNRFLVRGEAQDNKTAYTAWVYRTDKRQWWLLATFRTRTGGKPLSGLYSFIEDFRRDGQSVREVRRARFGNGWIKPAGGAWTPLAQARFTASNAEWESKENIDAGLAGDGFYLATGGDTKRSRALRSVVDLPAATHTPPADLPEPAGRPAAKP